MLPSWAPSSPQHRTLHTRAWRPKSTRSFQGLFEELRTGHGTTALPEFLALPAPIAGDRSRITMTGWGREGARYGAMLRGHRRPSWPPLSAGPVTAEEPALWPLRDFGHAHVPLPLLNPSLCLPPPTSGFSTSAKSCCECYSGPRASIRELHLQTVTPHRDPMTDGSRARG